MVEGGSRRAEAEPSHSLASILAPQSACHRTCDSTCEHLRSIPVPPLQVSAFMGEGGSRRAEAELSVTSRDSAKEIRESAHAKKLKKGKLAQKVLTTQTPPTQEHPY